MARPPPSHVLPHPPPPPSPEPPHAGAAVSLGFQPLPRGAQRRSPNWLPPLRPSEIQNGRAALAVHTLPDRHGQLRSGVAHAHWPGREVGPRRRERVFVSPGSPVPSLRLAGALAAVASQGTARSKQGVLQRSLHTPSNFAVSKACPYGAAQIQNT